MTAKVLDEDQRQLLGLGTENLLVVAPAGCGKTEALSARAADLIRSGIVTSPRRLLALTFSNRATRNLRESIRSRLGLREKFLVTVTNFHGLSARVLRAHGDLVDVNSETKYPQKAWHARALRALSISGAARAPFAEVIRAAKSGGVDDDEVYSRLQRAGNVHALSFQKMLREENRLDYDDLIRKALCLFRIRRVAALYQEHFAALIVDEVQDLTVDQFDLVRLLGTGCTTFAGDNAQGIYSFAGARPVAVFEAIRTLQPKQVTLCKSYRSSPAVLSAVNALAREIGTGELVCAEPERWLDGGVVATPETETPEEESSELIGRVQGILVDTPDASIGVIARRGPRLQFIETFASAAGIHFEDWRSPALVASVLRQIQRRAAAFNRSPEGYDEILTETVAGCRRDADPNDLEQLDAVEFTVDEVRRRVEAGLSLDEALDACRAAPPVEGPVSAGLHILNAHVGKGQEFDWVAVVGLEDGVVPDFRANTEEDLAEELRVLHVMVSRAKHGLVITRCRQQKTRYGLRHSEPSPWWAPLLETATEDWSPA